MCVCVMGVGGGEKCNLIMIRLIVLVSFICCVGEWLLKVRFRNISGVTILSYLHCFDQILVKLKDNAEHYTKAVI